MKACSRCKEIKELSCFPNKKGTKDGVRADCRICFSARMRELRQRPEWKAWKAAYQKSERYKEIKKRYNQSDLGRAKTRAAQKKRWRRLGDDEKEKVRANSRKWRKTEVGKASKDAERARYIAMGRYRVYHKVLTAKRNGTLKVQPCEKCGKKAQAHHDDYSKPLDVRWLCPVHHAEHHNMEDAKRA
jgi:hypothetical protein